MSKTVNKSFEYYINQILIGTMFSVAVSPNSRYVVSGSDDKTLNLYSVDMHNPIHQFLDAHEGRHSEIRQLFNII